VGCKSTDGNSAVGPKQRETAAAQLDKAKTETKEAAQAMQDYTYAQKAEFIDKMKKELVGIQEELDRLSARVDTSIGAEKADAKTKLEAVREKWARAKKQLDQAESATESDWDDVKGGFKKSYGELKDSFEKTRQWLSDKIEP
jgi:chromosome segregation ATPase